MTAEIVRPAGRQKSSLGRVMLASAIGSALEWYDFFIYGTAAALVFNELFFPKLDPRIGTLAAFATFGVGFFARPFGGLVFGHFGDRLGRKPMLVVTLLLVGIATFLIGLIPSYASIGILAPILLVVLRLLQGFGAGDTARARAEKLIGSVEQAHVADLAHAERARPSDPGAPPSARANDGATYPATAWRSRRSNFWLASRAPRL
jgi:MFS family permease